MPEGTPWRWLISIAAALALLAVLLVLLPPDRAEWWTFFVSRDTRPWLFLLLMTVLPGIGFPIVPFLLFVGIKFGPLLGFAVTAGTFCAHAAVSYALTHSLLRPFIWNVLERTRYRLPEIQERRIVPFSMIFMAIPALPYAMKNYALALLNVPLRIYMPVVWGINLLLAIPFVGLGHTLLSRPQYAWIFVALLGAAYLAAVSLRKRYVSTPKGPTAPRS